MIHSIQSYIQPVRSRMARLRTEPGLQRILRAGGFFSAGLALSAAALGGVAQPVALGFVLSCRGFPAVLAAAGFNEVVDNFICTYINIISLT